MENEEMIRIELICTGYNVEPSFIDSLQDFGLIEIRTVDESRFVEATKINDLEKMIRLHYDLDINIEGIETIFHLLERIEQLQENINELRNRLRRYGNDE